MENVNIERLKAFVVWNCNEGQSLCHHVRKTSQDIRKDLAQLELMVHNRHLGIEAESHHDIAENQNPDLHKEIAVSQK